jgi:hypothetical protein
VADSPAASKDGLDGQSAPSGCIAPCREGGIPKFRTPELVALELVLVRDQLDLYTATGRLRLAGECCVELDQLRSELAQLQDLTLRTLSRKAPGTATADDARDVVGSSLLAGDQPVRVGSPERG